MCQIAHLKKGIRNFSYIKNGQLKKNRSKKKRHTNACENDMNRNLM